jgi:peptidoglycan/xylan/chitin deacetylase (PgdA/CDA1 family)
MTVGNGNGGAAAKLGLRQLPMILMYHAIADESEDPYQLCVTPARFAEQMAWLRRRGLRGVSIGELAAAVRAGKARGMVGITFDDGYTSVLETALPELHRHGFGATAFIIADRLGATNEWDEGPVWPLLSGDAVRELARAGIEIGSHSATHPRLAGLPAGQLTAEVTGSRASLASLLGAPVTGFAYPYGSMDAAARRAVIDAGYGYACAVEAPPRADLGFAALPRVYVGQGDSANRMTAKRLAYRASIARQGRHQ